MDSFDILAVPLIETKLMMPFFNPLSIALSFSNNPIVVFFPIRTANQFLIRVLLFL